MIGVHMRRDWNVVRQIFAVLLSKSDGQARPVRVEGLDEQVVAYHLSLLIDAGFVDGSILCGASQRLVLAKHLTGTGHDFAASICRDDVWGRLRDEFGEEVVGALPTAIIKQAAAKLTSQGLSSSEVEITLQWFSRGSRCCLGFRKRSIGQNFGSRRCIGQCEPPKYRN